MMMAQAAEEMMFVLHLLCSQTYLVPLYVYMDFFKVIRFP